MDLLCPKAGWLAYLADEAKLVVYNGSGWVDAAGTSHDLASVARLGVNTSPDTANKLAVKSDTVLLSHDDVTPGAGDMRLTINKVSEAATASILFQNDHSGRA